MNAHCFEAGLREAKAASTALVRQLVTLAGYIIDANKEAMSLLRCELFAVILGGFG
jgi:hypothetical protein